MLYGKPTKFIRHTDEDSFTLEPQRFYIHKFWSYNPTYTARTDGLDLQDEKSLLLGSRVSKHKLELLVTPETIEPQQLYIGRIKLSFHDIYSPSICGVRFDQASYQDTATEDAEVVSNAITPHLFPIGDVAGGTYVSGASASNQEIGGSGSGYGITEWKLNDNIKHWINTKKVTVFDQRPLMGERWQRIPSKVKRGNEGTFYGLFLFNDSPRGATAADTQLTFNIKSYWEEWAL